MRHVLLGADGVVQTASDGGALGIEPSRASLELVRLLRAGGFGVHLGTNQESYRGAYMRDVLGYDALFDVSCYSYDLGVTKPDPGFFVEAARRIGADPAEVLFVDDTERNVEAARTVGMPAFRWDVTQGHGLLLGLLAQHGITVDTAGAVPAGRTTGAVRPRGRDGQSSATTQDSTG
ncbi:HAD superfamily hydrolase (TIGR01509 family) [Luteimicrobium subarcticum]|uniref:HAD superfamily hydrolase (TIGR01509 family) n=1 Tax=Luteimicrobium subarcticum TaxID=620910 RepID=A0A2M8WUF8_9MICO|nr:HAD superfamily hydrolase (TIGR01509 family) [Luteimicrobium subarcticum]